MCLAFGAAALMLATAASANLPKRPACADVPYSLVASAFGYTPTATRSTFTPKTTAKTTNGLLCVYYYFWSPPPGVKWGCGQNSCVDGKKIAGVQVQFEYPATKSIFNRAFADAHKGAGSARRVGGIGDAAFMVEDPSGPSDALVFLEGTDMVVIKAPVTFPGGSGCAAQSCGPGTVAALNHAVEAFAKEIIPLT